MRKTGLTKTRSRGIPQLFLLVLVCASASVARAQQLAITSPASGTVYSPGSTITVVASVTGGSVLGVKLAAQDIGASPFQTTAPYSFSFAVPTGIVGPRNVFAAGLIADETAVFSPIITVDVEPAAAPTSMRFQLPLVAFGYAGQQQRIGVIATFADGSSLDVTNSTQLKFASGSPTLVSVGATGIMTALAPGNGTVTATFGSATATLQTVGPTTIKGDLNGDGFVTVDDLYLLENMLGSTPTGPNDARDLNGDGKINNLDVQVLLAGCDASCPSLTASTTSLAASASQVPFAQPLTLTATVTGKSPVGTVTFLVDGALANTGLLGSAGKASVVSNSLSMGAHTLSALYDGDASNAPSASQTVSVTVTAVSGDVNGDGIVNCLDLDLVKAAFGKKTGQAGFNAAADLNHDGVVNVLDLSIVSRAIPAGTTCP
jgi:hypothetical protein